MREVYILMLDGVVLNVYGSFEGAKRGAQEYIDGGTLRCVGGNIVAAKTVFELNSELVCGYVVRREVRP